MDVYGLVGHPVGHSLSPPMQEAAFDALGIDARYVTFEPTPDDLEAGIRGAAALGIRGLNVTVPYKRSVLEFVELDPLAERIGAVNTIDFGEDPVGYNTDAVGAVRAIREVGAELDGTAAVVVGAGGAGRAIAVGLADAGATVAVANRTKSKAETLTDAIPGATSHGLDELTDLLADASALVNATSVGMDADESVVPKPALHEALTVMDAVYSPRRTRLLCDAADCGATTIDGTRMLVHQGAASFERWTGQAAPLETMEHTLERAIRRRADEQG